MTTQLTHKNAVQRAGRWQHDGCAFPTPNDRMFDAGKSAPREVSSMRPEPVHNAIGRVLAFLDTPNLYYSLAECSGGDLVPDYDELLAIASSRGRLVVASALVNDGFPEHAAAALRRRGYSVARSEGKDCDFRFIAEAIALHRWGDTFLICSGDNRYAELALALRALGKYVIVAAVLPSCSRELRNSADEFVRFPAKMKVRLEPNAPMRHAILPPNGRGSR